MEKASRNYACVVFAVLFLCGLAAPVSAVALDPHDNWGGQILEPAGSAALKAIPGEVGVVAMGPTSNEASTNNLACKGNIVTVDRPVSVETISVYLTGVTAGTTVEWAVYSSDTVDGNYVQAAAASAVVRGGGGYFESPGLGAVLVPGTFYWLGAFWDLPVTYHYSNSLPGAPLDFDFGYGTATYHKRNAGYTVFPGPVSFVGSGGSVNAPYRQTYTFRAVEVAELGPASPLFSTGAESKGNMITVQEPMTLQSIGLYLTGVPAGTNLYWAVYRSQSIDGTYEKAWEATGTAVLGGDGYFDSPAAMLTLEPSWFYWLGGYWDQPASYYYLNDPGFVPFNQHVGFGSMTHHRRDGSPFAGIPGPPTFVGGGTAIHPYQQRYVFRPGAAANLGENSDGSSTNASFSKANTLSVSTPQTLESFELYLTGVADNTTLYWYVYESPTMLGTYTKIWESSRIVTATSGYFSSGPVMVDLVPGMYYVVGGFWDLPVTYWFSNTLPGAPLQFPLDDGILTYHNRQAPFNTLPPPATFPGDPGSPNSPYWQRYVFSGSLGSLFYDGVDIGNSSNWDVTQP